MMTSGPLEANHGSKPWAFLEGHGLLWAIFGFAFVLRGWGLSEQPPLADEMAASFSATNYLEHGLLGQVMWYHPPLRNFVVLLSGKLFGGFSAWGLRFGSVFLGSLTIPALGYLGRSLFPQRGVAALAAFFLCIDPLHIGLSREAFQESTTPFFIVAGAWLTVEALRRDRMWLAYASGLCFGLATASKWHGLFPWFLCGLGYLVAPWFSGIESARRRPLARLLETLAAYGALPVTVYTAVYLPWLMRGYSLPEFFDFQAWLVGRQYHHQAPEHIYTTLTHRAYTWFLRPVAWSDFAFYEGKAYVNVAMGNFLVWLLTLPALFYSVWNWMKTRRPEIALTVALFLVSYLPLVLTTRGIWAFSAPPVIIFAFLIVGHALIEILDRGWISARVLALYLGLCLTLSGALYPMATFKTLEYGYLRTLAQWFSPHGATPIPEDLGR